MGRAQEIQAYSINDLCDIFGLKNDKSTWERFLSSEFPFRAIIIRGKAYFPKKPIDEWLEGKKPQSVDFPFKEQGRKKKWTRENSLRWNYPIPRALNDKFDAICKNINKTLAAPIQKGDFIRLAIEEFIERRPEFDEIDASPED